MISIDREKVIYDVANLSYVVADVRRGHFSPHSLHHVFDIREPGNIDRVNGILDLAIAEVNALISSYANGNAASSLSARPRPASQSAKGTLRQSALSDYCVAAAHEYLVARVMADWLETAFPPALAAISLSVSGSTSLKSVSASSSKSGSDEAVAIWREKRDAAKAEFLASLSAASRATSPYAFSRRLPPI